MDDVVRRCTGVLIGLCNCRHSLPQQILVTLVQALVISTVRYGISVYGSCNRTQMARIQRLLNFGARVIAGRRKRDHVSDVLRDLDWLSARNLHVYHSLMLLKRIIDTGQPDVLCDQLVTRGDVHMRETRQARQFHTPSIRSESGRRRFMYSAVNSFNELPQNIREKNMLSFRTELVNPPTQHLVSAQNAPAQSRSVECVDV